MATLKELKEKYIVMESISNEKHYSLYDKEKSGKHSRHLYLGYVKVENGVITHYPTEERCKKTEELDSVINNWIETCEHDPDTYNPDYRKSYVAEMRIHDYLVGLGFEFTNRTYRYDVIDLLKGYTTITIILDIHDRLDNDAFKIDCCVKTGFSSWLDLSADTCEDVIKNIRSVFKVIMLMSLNKSFLMLDKIGGVDLSDLDKITENKLVGINVKKTPVKDSIISILENALTELKGVASV